MNKKTAENGGRRAKGGERKFLLIVFLAAVFLLSFSGAQAQTNTRTLTTPVNTVDPNDKGFRLVVCDGPRLPPNVTPPKANYVACDFNGVMLQIQHLINISMVLGVLGAVVGFSIAGAFYITGQQDKIKRAKEIFQKVLVGFIIMLSAWFIVFQLLSWLTDNQAFKTLLGSP